jgi:hypothetical protein
MLEAYVARIKPPRITLKIEAWYNPQEAIAISMDDSPHAKSAQDRQLVETAYHKAGHAVAALLLGRQVHKVTTGPTTSSTAMDDLSWFRGWLPADDWYAWALVRGIVIRPLHIFRKHPAINRFGKHPIASLVKDPAATTGRSSL